MAEMIEIEILRYRPEQDNEPWMQTFQVPYLKEMSLLDALQYIKDQLDSTLSFRWSCRMAICGSCGMMVNGIPKLGCKTFLRDYLPGKMKIEPLNNFPIERDLVVDMSDFIEKLESIKPYIIPSEPRNLCDGEYIQTPADMAKYHQFSMCINCGLCYAACPQYGLNQKFTGTGLSLQRRQPRWRVQRADEDPQPGRRRLGLYLRGLLFRRLSQGRGSGRRHPAWQGRERQGLHDRHVQAGLRSETMNNTNSKRKPYVREMKKDWWLKNAFYTGYMIREGTSIFVSIYAVVLMWGLMRLVQGQEAFNGWLESLQSPVAILFHVIALAACLFHAKTWFALAPKAMRIFRGEDLVPEKPIVIAQYVALAVVSLLILIIVA